MMAPMDQGPGTTGVRYEFADKPDTGATMPVAPGILWLRMPLPWQLGHINLWLLEDGDGFTLVDSGVHTDVTKRVWQEVFGSAMGGRPAVRVIATHLHPDHVGCTAWLAARFGVDVWMTREEYLLCRVLVGDTGRPAPEAGTRFYRAAGFPPEAMDRYQKMFGMFGRYVAPLPESYRRLRDGDALRIGGRTWEVIVGRGHSPEHACLYCPEENVLISGDQLLPTISSNVSVYPTEPAANPLAEWLDSLETLRRRVPEDVLVLPAHGRPFRGAHARAAALIAGHRAGLERLEALCREPIRAVDAFPALFSSAIDENNLIMATGESIAHLNYLLESGRIQAETDENGIKWYRATPRA
jgi:glyoxylase-like metal-dependent hydrolase (beta-lactamase superfamily II)